MKKRRTVSIFLILIMAATLIPQGVFAAENNDRKIRVALAEQEADFDKEKDAAEKSGDVDEDKTDVNNSGSDAVLRQPELEEEAEEIDGQVIERDEASITYQTGNNSYVTRISGEPLTYTDESGREKEIDNTLKEKGDSYINKENSYRLTLPKDGEQVEIANRDFRIKLSPDFGELKNAVTEENAIRYNDVAEGIDIQYTALGSSVKEDVILMRPTELKSFRYNINGVYPAGRSLEYRVEGNLLNIYEKNSENKEPVYSISAPVMTDANGEFSMDISLAFTEVDDRKYLEVTPDSEWLAAKDRAYPVKIDPTIELTSANLEWHMVENGQSGGDFGAGPNMDHHRVSYLYVGYEDGTLLGEDAAWAGAYYGQTRSYLKINYDFKNKLPSDAIITAKLKGYKYAGDVPGGTKAYCKMVTGPWRGSAHTWNTQPAPANHSIISSAVDVSSTGWKTWDISTAVREWKNGATNYGLVLSPVNESQPAVTFSGPGNSHGKNPMYMDIYWTVPNPVDENMPLSSPKINLRPLTYAEGEQQIFTGILADGAVRPMLKVDYSLKETATGDEILSGAFKEADWGRKYPNTNLIKDTIKFKLGYTGLFESNWQTEGIPAITMEEVTPYRIYAKGSGSPGTTPPGQSDEFIIYQFKQKDTYPYVAKYYGTTVEQIVKDNRPTDYMGTFGSTIFIRNPKYNKTKKYVRETKLTDDHVWDIIYANLGRSGCTNFDLEPINTSTGNFMFETIDAQNTDYTEDFSFRRTYNSIGDKTRGYFGYGWSFEYDQSLTKEKGKYIYSAADGKKLVFEKDEDSAYTCRLAPHMRLSEIKDEKKPENNIYIIEDDENKLSYGFNCYGLLTSVTDEKNLVTRVNYDKDYGLKSVTTPSGKVYSFTLDSEGTVSQVTLPSGAKMQYEYDNDCLSAFVNADGDKITYKYDKNGLMTQWADGNGNIQVKNAYDEYGRVTHQTDAKGGVSNLSYSDKKTVIKDAEGNERTYTFDERYRTVGVESEQGADSTSYDGDNNVTALTDNEGNTGTFEYDEKGNITEEVRFDGKVRSGAYDGDGNLTEETDFDGNTTARTYDGQDNLLTETYEDGSSISYTYDVYGRVLSFTDEEGAVTKYAYEGTSKKTVTDGNGNSVEFYYDAMGREINRVNSEGIESKTMYSAAGKTVGTWITGGFSESYVYDRAGNCVSITDGNGSVSTFTYDSQNNMASLADGNGNTTTFGYDKVGNEISQTNPLGQTTMREYDDSGNKVSETDAAGNTTEYSYDGLKRLTKETNALGGTTTYKYEGDTQNITEESGAEGKKTYKYNEAGEVIYQKTESGAETSVEYDSRGRMQTVTESSGLITEYQYNKKGNLTEEKDSNGRTVTYSYDRAGNILSATDPMGNSTVYTYDKAYRLISETDAEGHTTSYTYNGAGNILRTVNPDGSTTSSAYDNAGNMISSTDENGGVTYYGYDAAGQNISETDPEGGVKRYEYNSASMVISDTDKRGYSQKYSYDKAGNLSGYTDREGSVYETKSDALGNLTERKSPDGGIITDTYDKYGRLIKESDKEGYVMQYKYDGEGKLAKEWDNDGNSKSYEYDTRGQLTSETDSLGRKAKYEYDAYGNPVKETTADGDIISYTYDEKNQVISIKEADGKTTKYSYDKIGNVTGKKLPEGRNYQYSYDAMGRTVEEINPIGEKTEYSYDKAGNLLAKIRQGGDKYSYIYDQLNRVTSETDEEGGTVSYVYDAEGNVIKDTDKEGNATEYIYDGRGSQTKVKTPSGAVTETQYNETGRESKVIYPAGGEETYKYDTQGNVTEKKNRSGAVTSYTYTKDGKTAKETRGNDFTVSYSYDKGGRITAVKNSEGGEKTFTYDESGNIAKLKEEAGNITSYTYDKGHRVLSETGAKGGVTGYVYDKAGNLSKMSYPEGGSVSYTYDLLDRVTGEKESSMAKVTFKYDSAGNVSEENRKDKSSKFVYDKTGKLMEEISPEKNVSRYTYDKNGNVLSVSDPMERKTSYEYDSEGNTVAITDAKGSASSYGYDEENNLTSWTNRENEKTELAYDKAGRLSKTTDAIGRSVSYEYDEMDNLIRKTAPDGSITEYSHDKTGHVTKEKTPSGKVTQFTYDTVGRVTCKINPDGSSVKYDYDVLGGLSKKSSSDGSKAAVFGYDKSGNKISMSDESGESGYTYDELGRLQTATDANGQKLSYVYDEYGRISEIHYPKGRKVVYNYDKDDNIVKVSDNKGITASYTYDKSGNILSCQRSDGTKTAYVRDENYNLTSLVNSSSDATLSSYTYEYDKEDRIISETESKDGVKTTTSFSYDDAGQLTGYTQSDGKDERKTAYSYNAAGNRTSVSKGGDEGTVTVTYNSENQVIKEENSKTGDKIKYSYDDNGNLIEKKASGKTTVYEYDTENRLRAVSEDGQILMAATYDGEGNKVFELSRKDVTGEFGGGEKKNDKDKKKPEEKDSSTGTYFDPDIFMYGAAQGGMKISSSQSPGLFAAIGDTICEIWEGIKTYITGGYKEADVSELCSMVVAGTEEGTFVTYDITNYVNDANFNKYSQVMYQYGDDGEEKASYVYGAEGQRLFGDLTDEAVKYIQDSRGDYTYLYDGQGSVTQNFAGGEVTKSLSYSPFGEVEGQVSGNDIFFGYNGEEYSAGTGLEYLRSRYYDPANGSFTSRDTYTGDLSAPISQNRYIYAANDPVNNNDPGGDRKTTKRVTRGSNSKKRVVKVKTPNVVETNYTNPLTGNDNIIIRARLGAFEATGNVELLAFLPKDKAAKAMSKMITSKKMSSKQAQAYRKKLDQTRQKRQRELNDLKKTALKRQSSAACKGSKYGGNNRAGFDKSKTMERRDFTYFWQTLGVISLAGLTLAGGGAIAGAVATAGTGGAIVGTGGALTAARIGKLALNTLKMSSGIEALIKAGNALKDFVYKPVDDKENTEGASGAVSKININQKPNVSNDKLKNIVNDLYKGQGGKNTVGNGTTMDAVRNELLTGQPTNGKFHMQKLKDYQNALQRRLRAGDLDDYDASVVNALIEDINKVLNGQ